MPNSAQDDLNFADLDYPQQLDIKFERFGALLFPYYSESINRFESPTSGYRMRAEFRVWHDGESIHYAMHRPGTKELYCVDSFPPAHNSIQQLMPVILEEIKRIEELRYRLFSAEFLSTLSGDMLVTLIYHKPLDDNWEIAARALQSKLGIELIGRSRKQKRVINNDHVTEVLNVSGKAYKYRQIENSFTQPNARVNEQMLEWATKEAKNLGGDLLELYCGNGNFTLPLSRHFRQVLTTEISKTSIAALRWNLEANDVDNVNYARLSAEEITQALDRIRPFRRLAHLDLNSYKFGTVFVDPPRAGIDKGTLRLLSRFENIIYISCNPYSLVENLEPLSKTHTVVSAAAFDQFPFTPHLEASVRLKKF